MQTLAALAHIDYNTPRLCSYELASVYMKQLGLGKKEVDQFFRRLVFNVLAVNRDDHVKNISFLMDRDGKWSLSPAYDITFSYNPTNVWLQKHQMLINNKGEGIEKEDLLQVAKVMGISKVTAINIISEVQNAVSKWSEIAEQIGIREQTTTTISDTISKLVLWK